MNLSRRFSGLNRYQKTAVITVFFTFLLIFIGGLVRASGAGLGCPDWPRCFGQWIPPLSASDLPAGYNPEEFSVFKTWMEYVNRLVGVLIGFLITLTFFFSFAYFSKKPVVFYSSVIAFILVLFQGWLGGQVVQSGLSEWLITIHMLVALLIVNVLMYASFKAMSDRFKLELPPKANNKLLLIAGLLLFSTLFQVAIGTQVREAIDAVKHANPLLERALWIYEIGWIDQLHRTFSWIVLILSATLIYYHQKTGITNLPYNLSLAIVVLVISQFVIGIVLAYLGMPPVFQVLHLLGASLLVGVEFLYILVVNESKKVPNQEYQNALNE
ncbi:MAG: COX15/CtaA family protein [Balneolales bacterium]